MPGRERASVATDPALAAHCRGLDVVYRLLTGSSQALHGVDADFPRGQLTVLAGPSGSGKSSLLRVLAGLHRPRSGTVVVDGVALTRLGSGARRRLRRRQLGIVLQSPADNLVEYLTAREQVELSARLRGVDPAPAADLLATVGLTERADDRPEHLSGGEQQRVAFAAAAIGSPAVLLADEPTAQLDSASSEALLESMRGLVRAGATLVVSSHDPLVIDGADHAVHLREGRVVAP